ncbi:PAS domain S-box protein [bacterium]|nr:MAG: PAS domain S-box protein [bacterium]
MPDSVKTVDFSVLEQLPVGIFITDTELRILFWNKKLELWTGKKREEVKGEIITELYPNLTQKNYIARITEVINGGPSVIFSSQLHPNFLPAQLPDGSYRIQNTTLTRNFDEKIGAYLVFTIQDITDTHRHLQKIKDLRKQALDEIKERERIQNELHESREMLASINRNITEGIFRIVPDIGITYSNKALTSLLGYESAESLMGTNPLSTHVISSNKDEILDSIRNGNRYINDEILIRRNDGTTFWAQLSVAILLDQNQAVRYADCLISDITIRKEQVQRIQESEEQFRNLFQNSMVGMYRINISDGSFLNVNKKGLEIFGFETFGQIQNHSLYRDKYDWLTLRTILQKKRVLDEMEVQLRRRDGSIFWASISAKFYPREGYVEGVVLDIEERKQAEILQAALYRIADRSNSLRDIKQFFEEIHRIINELMDAENLYIAEYDELKDLISFSYLEDAFDKVALPKKPGNGVTEYILRTGEPLLINEQQLLDMIDAKVFDLVGAPSKQFLGVPLRSAYKVIGVLAVQSYTDTNAFSERDLEVLTFVAQHVTSALERRRYENSLLESKDLAEAASKSKSLFLANMSHELRTPLNSIIGFTRRVLRKAENVLDEQSFKALETVQRNAMNLLKLINDVLDISKVEAGKISYNMKQLNLNEQISSVVEELEPLSSQKHIDLVFEPSEATFVKSDPMRLRQVLINIIGNGIKFTDEGSVSIRLSEVFFSGNHYSKVSVKDTGIGIKSDKLSVIFDVFEQVDTDSEQNRGGTGLGLAISKKMMFEMGGEIDVQSTLNEGSTFNIYIPSASKNSK